MIVKAEPDETVTEANFTFVREYILIAIDKGRMNFSGWPLETLQAIPDTPDPEGKAIAQLDSWVERHMLKKTRTMMFSDLREAQFEAAKRAAEVILSQETRNALRQYRDKAFGEGQGSMELAVKQLLELAKHALPQDAFQLLDAFRQRKGLKTSGDAIRALVDLAEKAQHAPAAPASPVHTTPSLHREIKQLLIDLKEQNSQ
ncbi:MAG: hypothetical protein H7839_06975 [Magnetococcus sp. YQC-5]